MRKQTKVVAVASAAALLAIGASMTSLAATGWVEEDGIWYFYDRDGNRVEDEWKKSGDNWYWMDSEEGGAMAIDKLVEDDDDTYYVDANGVMVRNTWVKVVNEDQDEDDEAEYDYYYMQSNGKAYKQNGDSISKKTIDGKRYGFDSDGKMLYGWVDKSGEMQNDDTGWTGDDVVYYFGAWDDGAMKTGWQKITVYDDEGEKSDDYDYWFNFKSNGEKRVNADKKKLNGKYYNFDSRGVMVYEWYQTSTASNATASNWNYFSSPEDGARIYKGWFKVAPPTEDNSFLEENDTFASSDSDDETERWYYADENGLVEGEIKKIKGKYYGFWPDDDGASKGGRMLVGLCALEMDGDQIVKVWGDDMDSDDLDDFMDGEGDFDGMYDNGKAQSDTNVYLYYFGDGSSQDTDGAMKTGNVSINLDGESRSFFFKKSGGSESRGRGLNGIDDGDYIYRYGMKVKADTDDKYILVYATGDTGTEDAIVIDYSGSDVRKAAKGTHTFDGVNGLAYDDSRHNDDGGSISVVSGFSSSLYLVNTSGKIQGAVTAKKDGDDWYWYSTKDGIAMYTSEKDFKGTDLAGNGWKDIFK